MIEIDDRKKYFFYAPILSFNALMDIIYSSVGIVRIFQTIKTIKRKVYHLYIVEHLVNLGLNGKLFTLVVDIDRLNSPCRPSC